MEVQDDVLELTDEERKELNLSPNEPEAPEVKDPDPDPATDPTPTDPPVDPEGDAPTDLPEDPPADPVANDDDPVMKAFVESGLSKQYVDPADAIRRMPDQNRYIESLQAQVRAGQPPVPTQPQPVAPVFDIDKFNVEFEVDPRAALKSAGFVPASEVAGMQQQLHVIQERDHYRGMADTVGSYEGLKDVQSALRLQQFPAQGVNEIWDEMRRLANAMPGMLDVPFDTQMEVLYPMATKRLSPKKPPIPLVPPGEKLGASTSSGASSGRVATDADAPDFGKMTSGQIKAYYDKREMIGD